MKREMTLRLIIVAVSAFWLLAAFAGCSHKKQLADKNRPSSAQLSDLQKQLSQIEAEKDQAQQRADKLQKELEQLAEREKLNLQKLDKYSILTLPNTLVFNSGSIKLSNEGSSLLGKIAEILKRYPDYEIRLEGHTDNKQIRPEFQHKYATNWELSAARATAVVRYLTKAQKMDPQKLGAVGYGEYRPIASNDNEQGRAKNRRVEFHIYPAMQTKVLSEQGKGI